MNNCRLNILRKANNQWYVDESVVETELMLDKSVLSEVLSVIAGQDHDRVVERPLLVEEGNDMPDVVVENEISASYISAMTRSSIGLNWYWGR